MNRQAYGQGINSRFTNSTIAVLVIGVIGLLVVVSGFIFHATRPTQSEVDRKEYQGYKDKAEQGDVNAQFKLGKCYADGHGVTKDEVLAARYYRKAAAQNDAKAQCRLGHCFAAGRGVELNGEKAVKWYRKAAEQDDGEAQYNLGFCYANGHWVAKDYAEAYAWYQLSFVKDAESAKHRADLVKLMSPQQIGAGKKRLEELRTQIDARLKNGGK